MCTRQKAGYLLLVYSHCGGPLVCSPGPRSLPSPCSNQGLSAFGSLKRGDRQPMSD